MDSYTHALKFQKLNRLYDSAIGLTMRESQFRKMLITAAKIKDGQKILDVGCGTGTLLIQIKKMFPNVQVYGIDGDKEILEIAKAKAEKAKVEINFVHGDAEDLPFEDGMFDTVVSSLVFHHLKEKQKFSATREVYRVLKDRGVFHLQDWSKPSGKLMRLAFYMIQIFDGFETTSGSVTGEIIVILTICEFKDSHTHSPLDTFFGTLAIHSGVKEINREGTIQ